MAYRVKLTKMSKNENALRTEEVDGYCVDLPEMKQSFRMLADPLDPKMDVRKVYTSDVQAYSIKSSSVIEFWTLNSKYRLDILDSGVECPHPDPTLFIFLDLKRT